MCFVFVKLVFLSSSMFYSILCVVVSILYIFLFVIIIIYIICFLSLSSSNKDFFFNFDTVPEERNPPKQKRFPDSSVVRYR